MSAEIATPAQGVTITDKALAHVRAALAAAGLKLVSLDAAATRTEKNVPVSGLIVVATA